MQQIIELRFKPQEKPSEHDFITLAAKLLGLPAKNISGIQILKKSLDARSKNIFWLYRIAVFSNEELPQNQEYKPKNVGQSDPVIIIGAGPAGLFCALKLIELGLKPIIIERGKNVSERRRDLAQITKKGIVNEDSNYCFGEGGAGTYSDGKLYTRSNKRGNIQEILNLLILHGAKPEISYEAHPHIGTNKLPGIIENIRSTIINAGGEVHFNARVTDLMLTNNQMNGVVVNNQIKISANSVVLATGHSARDIYTLLLNKKILIESKPFALGVRIEHPQHLIDSIQYNCGINRPDYLPAASYSLVEQINGSGVFSFCMCPGGIIAPAMTAPGEIVVNGWSPSKRNNAFANSGFVTSINYEDWESMGFSGPLAALKYQSFVEQKAYQSVKKGVMAPAQRINDFILSKMSHSLPDCSYIPGVESVNLNEVLPAPVAEKIKKGLISVGKKLRGFLMDEAIMVGTESRTSSPVKIPRDKITFMHPQISGLYPCGEGPGFAGGIVSAAMDGVNCASAIFKNQTIK